ncbi:flagellar hook-associated protein FlgK [Roseomonas sp. USHLN139]|uniref:flagellar hook-associated protein FlgK n=1 Tax=Roseomonas sp. USHLN139 TaxID=3081298 RepID=UPI003B011FDA
MSIQAALSNALSSLAAEQRHAMILANNIANASTPGYVRRDMPRSERLVAGTGSGVDTRVTLRLDDPGLAATSRAADASEAFARTIQAGLEAYNATVGQPADARSLSAKLGAFQKAMTTLSSSPDNAVSQSQVLAAAQDLVDTLHNADAAVARARSDADLGIAADVTAVNKSLDSLVDVDRQMALASARGASTAEYEDRRDVILAEIAAKLPIRTFDNGPGNFIVMTDGGNTLYDSTRAHHLSFTTTPFIPAEARHPASLSAVTVEGQGALRISDTGSIAAGLTLRDEILPNFVDMLDQVSARLLDSFQEADATLTGTQAGLFTDMGAANWDSSGGFATFTGLSRRIAINAAVDPDQGGDLWKLRTGMQAATDDLAADNSYVLATLDAMNVARGYDSTTGLPSSMTLSQAASQSIGLMQSERAVWTDRATTRASLALEARQDLSNKTGVNVDEELQRLLLVQQTYSASVQIIQAASRMLDELNQIR